MWIIYILNNIYFAPNKTVEFNKEHEATPRMQVEQVYVAFFLHP
jgi:hypothetical protein